MKRRHVAAWSLLALGLATLGPVPAARASGEVGTAAPDFTLQALDDSFHTLSDQRGKVVLLAIIGYG